MEAKAGKRKMLRITRDPDDAEVLILWGHHYTSLFSFLSSLLLIG